MAIYTPGAIVGAISGKLGGLVFVQAKKQSVVRVRPASRQGRSEAQQNSLARFTAIQQAWADLSDTQRLTWSVAAQATLITNRLGSAAPPGPFQLFVRENSRLRKESDDLIEEPPVGPSSGPPRGVTVNFVQGGPWNIQAQPAENFGVARFFVYGWSECKLYHTNTPPEFRFLLEEVDTALDVDIRDLWHDVWGVMGPKQVFTVAVANQTADAFLSDQVIVQGANA